MMNRLPEQYRRRPPRTHVKHSSNGESVERAPGTIKWGHCSTKGMRSSMEDEVFCKHDLSGYPSSGLFGVFDGHGGSQVSKFVGQALPTRIINKLLVQKSRKQAPLPGVQNSPRRRSNRGLHRHRLPPTPGRSTLSAVSAWPPLPTSSSNVQVRTAVRDAFFETDDLVAAGGGSSRCGTTACAVLVLADYYVFANAGDSRAILVSGGDVVFSTADHKPGDKRERDRIYEAGGYVFRGRVEGQLAVARALGDHMFKRTEDIGPEAQMVTCAPDITFIDRQHHRDNFLVVACDGVWDVMSNVAVADLVSDGLSVNDNAEVVAKELVDTALQRGSTDNLSVVIVRFTDTSVKVHTASTTHKYLPPTKQSTSFVARPLLPKVLPPIATLPRDAAGVGAVEEMEVAAALKTLEQLSTELEDEYDA